MWCPLPAAAAMSPDFSRRCTPGRAPPEMPTPDAPHWLLNRVSATRGASNPALELTFAPLFWLGTFMEWPCPALLRSRSKAGPNPEPMHPPASEYMEMHPTRKTRRPGHARRHVWGEPRNKCPSSSSSGRNPNSNNLGRATAGAKLEDATSNGAGCCFCHVYPLPADAPECPQLKTSHQKAA